MGFTFVRRPHRWPWSLAAVGLCAVVVLVGCGEDTDATLRGRPLSVDAVADSIVRVTGFGCGAPALGSGFAVTEHVVVTSGHLVTGRDTLGVVRPDGTEADAVLVAFDPDLDLALLRVDELEFRPVILVEGGADDRGAAVVVGSDNTVEEVDFVVDAPVNVTWDGVFRDTESKFAGLRLDADIQRGDSGSGLFVTADEVIGLVHSTVRGDDLRGYAVSGPQIAEYLATSDLGAEVHAPRCPR